MVGSSQRNPLANLLVLHHAHGLATQRRVALLLHRCIKAVQVYMAGGLVQVGLHRCQSGSGARRCRAAAAVTACLWADQWPNGTQRR